VDSAVVREPADVPVSVLVTDQCPPRLVFELGCGKGGFEGGDLRA
jgi:hypothetical protein